MKAVCPACGVAVVVGYVKCPKCGAALPVSRRAATRIEGGTAVREGGGFPVVRAALAGTAIAVVVAVALRGKAPAPAPAPDDAAGQDEAREPASDGVPTAVEPAQLPTTTTTVRAADPSDALDALDASLKRARLWGTASIVETRVDVRSGGCGDASMGPLIDGLAGQLRDGGLTRLRCMEQSGRVVFERDL